MKSETILRLFVGVFIFAFFTYLFGPLILMSLTAFNSSPFPRVAPWECFSTEWFIKLSHDERLMQGLANSLFIGAGVVLLAVPIGLAGAIMLTQIRRSIRSIYYTIVISPILVPGVVLGISTLIFWDRLGTMFNAKYNSFFYDGIFLTIVGQSTFISAYCMLVFIARLQRFDPSQEEAALDLGATHAQTFRKILLPFMRPAIGSAAVLAFLASFENYNTTVFTIISDSTLTTVLASKVRYGIDPSISSLAVIIVALTLIGATAYEFAKQREDRIARQRIAEGLGVAPTTRSRNQMAEMIATPAMALMVLITVCGLAFVWLAATTNTVACKAHVLEQKRLEQKRIQDLQPFMAPRTPAPAPAPAPKTTAPQAPSETGKQYQGIFAPKNLENQSGSGTEAPTTAPAPAPQAPGGGDSSKQYQGIFDPGNLKGQVEGKPSN